MKYRKRRKWERQRTLTEVMDIMFKARAVQIAANVRRHNALLKRLQEIR